MLLRDDSNSTSAVLLMLCCTGLHCQQSFVHTPLLLTTDLAELVLTYVLQCYDS
jgi:hypothetical protein